MEQALYKLVGQQNSILSIFAVGGAEAKTNGFSKSIPKTDVFNVEIILSSNQIFDLKQ